MSGRERFLATAFVTVLVAWGAWEGIARLYAWQTRLDARERANKESKEVIQILSESKDMWKARAAWMKAELPRQASGEAATTLLETMEAVAGEADVTLTEKALLDMEPEEDAHRAGAKVKFEGEFFNVMQWIYAMQQPDKFISSPHFSVSADEEKLGRIRGELVLVQWYNPL